MTKCKKLLAVLVSVVCLFACSFELVACGGNDKPDTSTYTVTVTDTSAEKNPIANVSVELWCNQNKFSPESGNYLESNMLATAKTKTNGKAEFKCTDKTSNLAANEFNAVEGGTYYAKAGEALKGYELHTEKDTTTGLAITSFNFDENRNATITFDYKPNNFYTADKAAHPYVREFKVENGNEIIDAAGQTKTLELQVKPGVFSYFTFAPYKTTTVGKNDVDPYTGEPIKKPGMTDQEAEAAARNITNKIVEGAKKAASGVYDFTLTATPSSAAPALTQFYNIYNGFDKDSGEPLNLAQSTTVTLKSDTASSTAYFYVTASVECTVTVTVTRTADVEEETKPSDETVPVVATQANAKPVPAKQLTAVPENSTIVKGDDGYYHLNDANGPLVLVMLGEDINNLVSDRVGDPLTQWKTDDGNGNVLGNGYICTNSKDGKKYDYENFVKAYKLNAMNSDNVCYVTDEMKSFLEIAAKNYRFAGITPADKDNLESKWMLPCVYYAQDNPAVTLNQKFDMVYEENDVVFTFTPEESGWYNFEGGESFSPVPAEIDVIELNPGSWNFVYDSYEENNKPFRLEAGTKYVFNLMFGGDAIFGDTYSIKLIPCEAPLGLTVGEDQEVTLDGPTKTDYLEFDGDFGTYTITVDGGRGLFGQEIILYVYTGENTPEQEIKLNAANNYTSNQFIYRDGYKYAFSCAGNLTETPIWVTIAAN
ncbi:MAG: hypothetical protein K2L67_05305 [Clostridia bacterium]|nr:hypothetical protein [Clostridia bacterium]